MSPDRIKGGARQAPELATLETEAQQVLNQLWAEKLLPFELNVGKITKHSGHYTVHFHDSRMYTADVALNEGQSWAEMVRVAVLERVANLSGPCGKDERAIGSLNYL
jgi:hypothetical protein